MPPSARSRWPAFAVPAPVKAFFSCPKSSLSSSGSGSAPQCSVTNGPALRALFVWMIRAASVLPVPVGPVMSTGASLLQACAISTKQRCIAGAAPTMSDVALGGRSGRRFWRLQHVPQRLLHLREVERFHEVGGRAEPFRGHGVFEIPVRGDDHDGQSRPAGPKRFQHLECRSYPAGRYQVTRARILRLLRSPSRARPWRTAAPRGPAGGKSLQVRKPAHVRLR